MRVCANVDLLCGGQRVIQSVLSCHFVESGDETQACRKVFTCLAISLVLKHFNIHTSID